MLVSPNLEELFVFSTFFSYPLNRSILKYYMNQELQLLRHSLRVIPDPSTLKLIREKIGHITQVSDDLKNFFPNIEIKEDVFERASLTFGCSSNASLKTLVSSDVKWIKQLKEEIIRKMKNELDEYDPLTVIATISMNISKILDRDSLFGLEFFRTVWEYKQIEEIVSEIFSRRKFGPSFFELTGEIMNEAYRQILLTTVDMQRRIRKQMMEYLSIGEGRKKISFEGLLRLASLLFSADSLDRIAYHLQIDVPIYIVEGRCLALFFPKMSTIRSYPYHVTYDTQYKRLVAHYASSVEPQMNIPYLDLIKKRHKKDLKNFVHLFKLSASSDQPLIIQASRIRDLKIDESIPKTKYNPFAKIRNSEGEWLLTTSILVHDAFFRFVWSIRATEHFKRVGSSFEDSVDEYFSLKFPDSHLKKHLLFHIPGPGADIRKYEIDLLFKLDNTLVCVECKDYALIEDPDDFRQTAQRIGLLSRDCTYFNAKIDRLIRYFAEFSQKNREFADAENIIPAIVVMHPDLETFSEGIPVITKYELVRLLNFLTKTGLESLPFDVDLPFKDISGVTLKYRILKIKKR